MKITDGDKNDELEPVQIFGSEIFLTVATSASFGSQQAAAVVTQNPSHAQPQLARVPKQEILELETKALRRFPYISQSWRRPLLRHSPD